MHINTVDGRKLGIVIGRPPLGEYWNWTKGAWESPFNAANHVRPMAPVDTTAPLFAGAQTADVGSVLLDYSDAVPYFLNLDSTGAPLGVVDQWTSPNPIPLPVSGGYTRL